MTYQELHSIPFEEEVRLGHERIKKMDKDLIEFRRNQTLKQDVTNAFVPSMSVFCSGKQ